MENERPARALSMREKIEAIAKEPHWDSERFNDVLLALAPSGGLNSVTHPPLSIDLAAWKPELDTVWQLTEETGHEHGSVLRADVAEQKILPGRITEGTESQVDLVYEKDPGREQLQVFIASIHTHPTDDERGVHRAFSAEDYISFLHNRSEQAMVIMYGANEGLLMLKTPNTNVRIGHPKNSEELEKRIRTQVTSSVAEFSTDFKLPALTRSIAANKQLCVEYQLSLYRMTTLSGTRFERIEVSS